MRKKIIITTLLIITTSIFFIILDNNNHLNDITKLNRIVLKDSNQNIFYEANNFNEGNYLTIEEIPPLVINIFLYSEDKNFYKHHGYDPYRIIKSITSNSSSGASTITQQLIKNLYLTEERSYLRKGKELYLSLRLEQIYTKDEILEAYFNTLYFAHNLYGLKDASAYYFNKEPFELTISEIAILCNIIKNPSLFSPELNPNQAFLRRNFLLKNLYSASIINKDDYFSATHEKIDITKTRLKLYSDAILFYKDLVLLEYKKYNLERDFNQTIIIQTAFDSNLNKRLDTLIQNKNLGRDVSIIITDNEGYYLSVIGGANYQKSSLNIGISGLRQVASTIKPLLFYSALEAGLSPLYQLDVNKTDFIINGDTYQFKNASNLYEKTPISMGTALATSDNIYALKLHTILKLNGISKQLKKFGITSKPNIQQALGNVALSLNELNKIYSTFQNLGKRPDFKTIKSIQIDKKIIIKTYPSYTEILNDTNCFILNEMLTWMFDSKLNNIRKVTGNSMVHKMPFKVAGKSGTDLNNSYMIGFNKTYLISAFVGGDSLTSYEQYFSKEMFLEAYNVLINKNDWYDIPTNVKEGLYQVNSYSNYQKIVYRK